MALLRLTAPSSHYEIPHNLLFGGGQVSVNRGQKCNVSPLSVKIPSERTSFLNLTTRK
jgi:hypothetical protein